MLKNSEISTMNGSTALVWFRRDLRLANNPALDYAVRTGHRVIPIYIESNVQGRSWAPGSASRWWGYHSLERLSESLAQQGLRLHFFSGDPGKIIQQLIKETGAITLCWNKLYEPEQLELDKHLLQTLPKMDLQCFDSNLLFPPGTLLNKQGDPYRVFTPFWKSARQQLEVTGVNLTNTKKYKTDNAKQGPLKGECTLQQLNLLDENHWHEKLNKYWSPGEKTAQKCTRHFIQKQIGHYEIYRDIPGVGGTSKLSAHLHFGEITSAQIVYQLQQQMFSRKDNASVETLIKQLGWREFAHHILWHFPYTTNHAMNNKFKTLWPNKPNQKRLQAWQKGQTGIALVDAGMRQLWETGWMHNRVRMIVGSFLTKNLGIHWLHGAKWFWDTLVDADLANNTLGWQWVAGCGVDAAPYYRIFNPDTQAKRFDPDLTYIKHWLPEIDELPQRSPLIDLKESREDALARFKGL